MGRLQGIDQGTGAQALGDLESAVEILRPALLLGRGDEPAGEPVIVLGPGGEGLGLAGRSRLLVPQGLDHVERRARILDRPVAGPRGPAHPHALSPGEGRDPGVLCLVGELEGAVDRVLRRAGIGLGEKPGQSVEAEALVPCRRGGRKAGVEMAPRRLAR